MDVVDEGERIAHVLAAARSKVPGRGLGGLGPPVRPHAAAYRPAPPLGRPPESSRPRHVSVHFGRERSTLIWTRPRSSTARLVEAELRANRLVAENRPVEVSFEEAGNAERTSQAHPRGREPSASSPFATWTGVPAAVPTCARRGDRADPHPEGRAGEAESPPGVPLRRAGGAPGPRRLRPPHPSGRPVSASADELPALVEAQRASSRRRHRGAARAGGEAGRARARDLYAARRPNRPACG